MQMRRKLTRSYHYTYNHIDPPNFREKSPIHSKTPSLEGIHPTQLPSPRYWQNRKSVDQNNSPTPSILAKHHPC